MWPLEGNVSSSEANSPPKGGLGVPKPGGNEAPLQLHALEPKQTGTCTQPAASRVLQHRLDHDLPRNVSLNIPKELLIPTSPPGLGAASSQPLTPC